MKKTTFTLVLTVFLALGILAQELEVIRKNGTVITVQIADIDSITFPVPWPGDPCIGAPTVTDIDGNIYNTVQIGSQCWMKENLKTTKYRNGNDIDYPGSSNGAWTSNSTGAYAWYNNDPLYGDYYGALYNWYAAANTDVLCPIGWHLPSDGEWDLFVTYIEGINSDDIANQLKSCRQVESPLGGACNTTLHPRWDESNTYYGTDDYGYSALPGGKRSSNYGTYSSYGNKGYWWSSTEISSSYAWYRFLYYISGNVTQDDIHKRNGLSVRCVKD